MGLLTRDEILQADDLQSEQVAVPEWGGDVIISTLTGTDRDAYEAGILTSEGKMDYRNLRAKLLARCIVDESGKRLFNESDVAALGKKSAAALDRCFSVASRLNAVSDSDLEELAKN